MDPKTKSKSERGEQPRKRKRNETTNQFHNRLPDGTEFYSVSKFCQAYVYNKIDKDNFKRVTLDKPVEVGCLSRLSDKSWKFGSRQEFCKYVKPRTPSDLNVGFQTFIDTYSDIGPESLSLLLNSVKKIKNSGYQPNIITWRGALRKIMTTPYLRRDRYTLGVWKRNKVLYIQTRQHDQTDFADMNERSQRFMYYGYKFEEVCTRPVGGNEQQPNPNCCFNAVFKSKIGDLRLLYGGEVDCFDGKTNEYVELKVTRLLEAERQIRSFERYKLLKFYCQAYLARTSAVIVGFRDDDGKLRKVQKFDTFRIPGMVKNKGGEMWNHKVCLVFLEAVLSWLWDVVPEASSSGDVLEFEYNGDQIVLHSSRRKPYEHIPENEYW